MSSPYTPPPGPPVPDAHDIAVATTALRAEAWVWSTQASALEQTRSAATRLGFDRLQAGVFQLMVTAHADLAAAIAARRAEATTEMGRIAVTLHEVADTYDDEERRHVHALRHLY